MTGPVRFLLGALLLAAPAAAAAPPAYTPALEARVFDRAWRIVDTHYWDRARTGAAWAAARDRFRSRALAAPDRRAFYTLLGEMLAALGDSHVYAIDPVQVAIGEARDAGRDMAGFGLTMLPDDAGEWRVTALRPAGPAAAAGIQLGWQVAGVDGAPVDIDFDPAPGDRARFDLVDDAGAHHLLTLAAVLEQAEPPWRARRLPGDILLIALDSFERGAERWLDGQLAEGAPPRGLILDLRGNDGGDADVVARVAGRLFDANRPLVRRIAARARQSEQRTAGAGPHSYRGPLAVLIGPDSASGAEALAALIDEAGRGVTIGQRTAGALTGAAFYRLPDGGQLAVAEFDIRTPAGQRLEGVGLAPRVPVTPTLADRRAGRDPVLDKARALIAIEARAPSR